MKKLLACALLLVGVLPASATTVQIVDGDTLTVDGTTYRLHGIDTPEHGQKCKGQTKDWPCGRVATNRLAELTTGRSISCDNRGSDDYDRIIAVCMADDIELNATLVSEGLAWAFVKFSDDYVAEEETARQAGLGVWQAPTETPSEYRARRWDVAAQEAPEGCPIKGNISKNGMIYHAPWSPWYSRTKISLEKGERWFCSEREALDAGWRAPRWGR